MPRTLALDIGLKRTGAAITDDLNITAQPLGARERIGYKSELEWIKELMEEYEIERVLIGHPLNMDGSKSEMAKICESVARKLEKELAVEITLWDERLTTAHAQRILTETGATRKKKKKKVDTMAAQLLLSNWLESGGP